MEDVTEPDEGHRKESKQEARYKITNMALVLVLVYNMIPMAYSFASLRFDIFAMIVPMIFLIIDVIMILGLLLYRKHEKEIIPYYLFILSGLILSILDIQSLIIVGDQVKPFFFSLSIPIFFVGVVLMLNKWEHEKPLNESDNNSPHAIESHSGEDL
ncbi:MAG: hypothetical protein EAX95_04510 [Candidatus Thorarchaeota archaeon]|nr:hypothetical protein [Candidatus Thorarchaeota archaeon]